VQAAHPRGALQAYLRLFACCGHDGKNWQLRS
jgi:hypothetical protein